MSHLTMQECIDDTDITDITNMSEAQDIFMKLTLEETVPSHFDGWKVKGANTIEGRDNTTIGT